MDKCIVFIPYGSRLGFHENGVASTMANIDYKFPQCVCYAIEGNVVDRISNKNGKGWCEDVSPTLNTQDRHAVVYEDTCVFNESGKGYWMEGFGCIRAEGENRPSRPSHVVISLEGNGARPSHMGKGFSEDGTMYTLNTIEQHSVCYEKGQYGSD